MSRHYVLRELSVLDLDRAAMLHCEAFVALGETGWSRQDLAELLASAGVAGLLGEADARAIGFALWRRAAGEAELLTLAVSPTHRRRGVGRSLVEEVVRRARHAGAADLFLEVGTDNPAARALYDKMGFVAVGRRAGYYRRGAGPAADAAIMRLGLS